MLIIEINNIKSQIVGFLDKDTITKLLGKLSYEMPGAYFAQRYNPFAGVKYLFTRGAQSFPTGLIHYVEEILQSKNIQYQIVDKRIPITLGEEIPFKGPSLRDYQLEAINRAVERQRGIIKVATGGGKSNIASGIIARLNVPTLVLTHKTDLLYQLKRGLEKTLQVPIGIIGDGQFDVQKITVGMIQTISRVYDKPKKRKAKHADKDDEVVLTKAQQIDQLVQSINCLITDECHHCPSDSFWNVHKHATNAFYKIGLSASPWREDNADLLIEAAHAKQLIDIPASILIEQGYLVQPKVYLYQFKHEKKQRTESYPEIYDAEIVNNFDRNKVIISSALKAASQGKTVLIAVTKVEHGKILEAMLQQVEPNALFVYGESESDVRQQVLLDLDQRKRKIVICTTIFGEGIDCPNLDVLINAKASASSVDAFQLIGRVLRKTPQKTKAYIIDIFDQSCKYLGQHSRERLRIYQTEARYLLYDVYTVNDMDFNDKAW